jgi:hypothetical protein
MPKSSKTGKHGTQAGEQREHVLHVRLRSQSQQLDCFQCGGSFGSFAARQAVTSGPTGGLASHGKSIEPMVVEFRHTSLSVGSLKLFPATRTAIARTRSSLEHELEHGHGLALATAHELGVGRRCDSS